MENGGERSDRSTLLGHDSFFIGKSFLVLDYQNSDPPDQLVARTDMFIVHLEL